MTTKKKAKRQLVPRTKAGGTMTESQFWGTIRSALRRVRWAPKYQALKDAGRPHTGDGRHKTEYKCETCKQWFKGKDVELDHIIPCGSLLSWEDLPGFAERLFCEKEGFRVLCKECHKDLTYLERYGKVRVSKDKNNSKSKTNKKDKD